MGLPSCCKQGGLEGQKISALWPAGDTQPSLIGPAHRKRWGILTPCCDVAIFEILSDCAGI